MSTKSRIEVFKTIQATGLVPVFYHADTEQCKQVIHACYQGGVRTFEFTNRGPFAHEVFAVLRKYISKELPDLLLGAGTILDAGTASLFIQNGADFIVSPALKQDIAQTCNRRKVLWIPGCATLTEISQAEEWGAEIIKIFPGDVLQPAFVKALKAPMPWTNVMVTGGVEPTRESIEQWFKGGVSCVGMGSKLIPFVSRNEDMDSLRERIKEIVQWIYETKVSK